MKRLRGQLVGVDQGSVLMFSDFDKGGPMWTGNGPRDVRKKVVFAARFAATPAVQVSMSMLDLDQKTNPRVDLTAEKVTREGFTLVFKTWADTRVARVRADWLAIGEVEEDETPWEV